MRTELRASQLSITPGQPSSLEIEVTNTSDVIDGITVTLDGFNPAWVELPVPWMPLFPGASAAFPVRLNVPTSCLAGEYPVIVRVVSTIDATRHSSNELWVTVEPAIAAEMELRPQVVTGGSRAAFSAVVVNTGNRWFPVMVHVEDDARQLACVVEPAVLDVPAGEYRAATLYVKGPRPWFGQTATRSLVVSAQVEGIELREIGTFIQKPRIPRGLLTFAILAAIVALWATIFLLVVNRLNQSDQPAKAVPDAFMAPGPQSVPLSVVGGHVDGTVKSADGKGIASITVEASRVVPTGPPVPTASVATGEDGTYSFALLSGTYVLRFSADGFAERWFSDPPTNTDPTPVRVEPKNPAAGRDVVLTGNPGRFEGSVVVPEGGDPLAVIVTVKAKDASPDDTGVPASLSPATASSTQVSFTVGDLPTPGDYVVSIDGGDLDPVELQESLGGGETKVLNTVQLGAAPGGIRGKVSAVGGVPLGGVNVVVRSAGVEQQTVTPTSGDVGSFAITGLPTPSAYTITSSAAGYGSQTITIDLLAGRIEDVNITLQGGTGTINGRVVDNSGAPLGGVAIRVTDGSIAADSATLTSASGSIPEGGYTVGGLPAPGNYTVTFTLDGFQTETRRVVFLGPGPQNGMDAILRPAGSTVSGTVRASGTTLAEAAVELTDGITPRTTKSVGTPAGGYVFTNVPPGTYVLTVAHPKYGARAFLVRVVAGTPVILDVDLTG